VKEEEGEEEEEEAAITVDDMGESNHKHQHGGGITHNTRPHQ
jgi:hypothetical protein